MRSFRLRSAACLAVLGASLGWSFPPPASAQAIEPAVIAVVDVQFILRESTAAESVRAQVDEIRRNHLEQVNVREEELRQQEQELKRQQSILTPHAFNEKRREFRRRVADAQREAQQRLRALDQMRARGLRGIERALRPIIVDLSKERGFNIVLASTQLVFGAKSLDITKAVLERLDQALPTVDLAAPSE